VKQASNELGDIKISSEHELLLACSHVSIDGATAGNIRRLLQQPLDWSSICRLAIDHRVVPLLYRALVMAGDAAVPWAALDLLRDEARASAGYGLQLTGELLRLLDLLRANGIGAIPWKGPALAQAAYGNLSLRQFDDLDILVRQQDIMRARDVLIEASYSSEWGVGSRREQAYLASEHAYPLENSQNQIVVELHYRIRERFFAFPLDMQELWDRATLGMLAGRPVLQLPIEDLLLVLCVHGATHCWDRLAWICDIAELIGRNPQIHWDGLFHRAAGLGSSRIVALGLLLAHRLLGVPLPEAVVRRIYADEIANSLATEVAVALLQIDSSRSAVLDRSRFHLRVRERIWDRLRYCFYVALTANEEDWAIIALPRPLSFVYTFLRPFRLLGTYGLRPLRRSSARQSD
jgi:hypothetical protein